MFITGPLLITAPMLLKRQPCINNYIIIIIILSLLIGNSKTLYLLTNLYLKLRR